MENKVRSSNIELLRIVAMGSIVAGHYVGKGGIIDSCICKYQMSALFFFAGGKLGVNIFALIVGYFGDVSVKHYGRKIIDLYFEVLFYSLLSLCLFFLFEPLAISIDIIKKSFFPISYSTYWFCTTVFGVYFLQPYLNIVLCRLLKNAYFFLVVTALFGMTIIPTMLHGALPFFSDLAWFITLYIVGFGIRKYDYYLNKKLCVLAFAISWIFMWGADIYNQMNNVQEINYFSYMFRVPLFVASFSLFMLMSQIKIPENRCINSIAKCTFAVYLVHDSLFFRYFFWTWSKADCYYQSWFYLIHLLICIVAFFGVSMLIERIRMWCYKKTICKFLAYNKITAFLDDMYKLIQIDASQS